MRIWTGIRLRWYIFALTGGLFAAAATYFWLDGPNWRDASAGPGHNPHFSRDGKSLSTFHGLELPPAGPIQPRIVKWALATGRKLSDTPIAWEGPSPATTGRLTITTMPRDARVLVGAIPTAPVRDFQYYVHDTTTGKKIAGPISSRHWISTCSEDGRWCKVPKGDFSALAIVDVNSGAVVLDLKDTDAVTPWSSAFSPDGSRVAIHWLPKAKVPNRDPGHFVVIHDLPSGREMRRFPMPARPWQRINTWEADDRLYAEFSEPDPTGPGFYSRRSFSFDMTDAGFGSERPELMRAGHVAGAGRQTYWDTGPGWVARYTTLEPDDRPPLYKVMQWIDGKLSTSLTPTWKSSVRIQMLDHGTSEVRCEVPYARMGSSISPDGRWIASAGDVIEVWTVPPPRQLTWAIIAGLALACLTLIVGRLRSRRLEKLQVQS